eukprot:Gb_27350 [translate_table: standard]
MFEVKGLASSIATLANWLTSWAMTMTVNLLLEWSSVGTFMLYALVCVVTLVFVALCVPGTKGKTLEKIQWCLNCSITRMTTSRNCMFEGVKNENERNLVECEENLKHFCKVCKRRFVCGQTLRDHMRVHIVVGGGEVNGIRVVGVAKEVEKRRLKEPNRSSYSIEEEEEGLNSIYTLCRYPKQS